MSTENKELIKLYFSEPLLMEVKNPMWDEFRMKSKIIHDQYIRNKDAEFPSWMPEKLALSKIKIKNETS